ncbi:phage tail tape measure protein [Aurantimonas sp. Leaf443]|uniref:phage tail tape measure protein n=1 Tax=Aurantimonas sp. Leaf443 TaxID=1736378 RepID=UPI0006FDE585|nr:phage tail tape measure protein [Aurantimonas sp. Leaf443]KQT88239.1 phage tail protein [Aurantimonas sp. Leaf443]
MDPDDTIILGIEADTSGLDRALGDLTLKAGAFGTALTGALKGAATGGRSLDAILQGLGRRLSAIALDAALRPLGTLASGLIGQALGGVGQAFGMANAVAGARIVPFAKGGVVSAPTFFPAGRQMGLMGEAGAEAILPLRRGADGALGVSVAGGTGRGASSIVFNVTTPDAASFRRSEAQIQAMLARAAQRGRRGL